MAIVKIVVVGVEPSFEGEFRRPLAPVVDRAELGAEREPVVTQVNQFVRVVLSGGQLHDQAHADDRLVVRLGPGMTQATGDQRYSVHAHDEDFHRRVDASAGGGAAAATARSRHCAKVDIRTFEFATFFADVTKGAYQIHSLRWVGGSNISILTSSNYVFEFRQLRA